MFAILQYGIVFGAIILAVVYPRRRQMMGGAAKRTAGLSLSRIFDDDVLYRYAMLLAFVVLSAVAFFCIGPYYDTFTQARYGYLLATSTALVMAMVLNDARQYVKMDLRVVVPAVSVLLLMLSLIWYLTTAGSPFQLNTNSGVFVKAASVLNSLGYGNCRIVTNDWIYMLYRNVSAFPQFYYNATTERYPILAFYNWSAATDVSSIVGLAEAKAAYTSMNFSVLMPENSICQR
jgi:hypothetical protein